MMDCLDEIKLNEYVDDSLTKVEKTMVRDHLLQCQQCRTRLESYEKIEKMLKQPVYYNPPDFIEKNVLKKLFPWGPGYASIFALIAASFMLLVTSIYVYFDFANNSIIQAYQMTSNNTINWLGSFIKTITAIFTALFVFFKTVNKFVAVIFDVHLGVELVGLITLTIMMLSIYLLSRFVFKKSNAHAHSH